MSHLPLIIALLADPVGMLFEPIELDVISVERAWVLDGRPVRSTFTVSCPPDTHGDLTVLGAGHDEVERTAIVPKNLLVDTGHDVSLVGVLRVIQHPPGAVNGVFVKGWTEIRISPSVVVR